MLAVDFPESDEFIKGEMCGFLFLLQAVYTFSFCSMVAGSFFLRFRFSFFFRRTAAIDANDS
jgi:hypothetical protein